MAEAFLSGVVIMFIFLFLVFYFGNYVASALGLTSGTSSNINWLAGFLGIPADTASWPNALWYIIMPMMATLAIIYGFLEELRIFRNAPNGTVIYTVIGITWSGLLMYTGALKVLALLFYQVGALVAAGIFSIVFIIGVVMWGVVRGKSYTGPGGFGRSGWGRGGEFETNLLKTGRYEVEARFKEADRLIHELDKLKSGGRLGTDIGRDLKSQFQRIIAQLGVDLGREMTDVQKEKLNTLGERYRNLG